MTISLEQFQQNFGKHPIPKLLQDLLKFQNAISDWYSGSFELDTDMGKIFKTYLGENAELLAQFLPFGHDANGSVYALWCYKDRPLEETPVIYINSEGEGNTVLANTLLEFFLILAWDEEPLFGAYSIIDTQIVHTPKNQEFRAWLKNSYGLSTIPIPNDIVQNARNSHPDFQVWLNEHMQL